MRRTIPLLVVLLTPPLSAQTPYLVRDINTTYVPSTKSSSPSWFTAYQDRIYFTATTDAAGTELWSTDGTSAGTSMVSDIAPGPDSSEPAGLTVVNGMLLFDAPDASHRNRLWATDGTSAGTHVIATASPGPFSLQQFAPAVYGNTMLFSAFDAANGNELWVTDGTADGTHLVKDIEPGIGSSIPSWLTPFKGRIDFGTVDALWETDGTDAGTLKIAPVRARRLAVAGDRLFFEGYTPQTGWELWVSDGSAEGTHIVADILSGADGAIAPSYDLPLIVAGDRVFFIANDGAHGREMWVSDGTAAGTHIVRDFTAGPTGTWDSSLPWIIGFGDRAYFAFRDDAHGGELWTTDGTDSGTGLFVDLEAGPASSNPAALTVSDGKLYFATANTLWVSDGTATGTHPITGSSTLFDRPYRLWPIAGKLYFAGINALTGSEPWVTDDSPAGAHMIANVARDPAPSSNPMRLTAAGELLFFCATDGIPTPAVGLWRSDGTEAGTFKLKDSADVPLTRAGRLILFPDNVNSSKLTMMSDGTREGTKSIDDFQRRFGAPIGKVFSFGDTVYVTVNDAGLFDESLWKTIGMPNAPAVRLGTKNPRGLIEVAGRVMFYAEGSRGPGSYGLWVTDGTPAGTHAVIADLGDLENGEVHPLVNAAGTAFFLKRVRGENWKLWKSDGTSAGTVQVKEWPSTGMPPPEIQAAGHNVFILINGALWVSDGTADGTKHVIDDATIFFRDLWPAGDRIVFFREINGSHELWGSDGTVDGTKLLAKQSFTTAVTSIDGIVYFVETDDVHGAEMWSTDGTPEGTKLLADVDPGPSSSLPAEFTKIGNVIYFAATTQTNGRELWTLRAGQPRRRAVRH